MFAFSSQMKNTVLQKLTHESLLARDARMPVSSVSFRDFAH